MNQDQGREIEAHEIMTTNIITMGPKTNLMEAMDTLIENKISGAPVVDEKGELVGVITEKDILVSMRFLDIKDPHKICVEEFMTKAVIMFPEDIPIENIVQVMLCKNIKRVPIVKDKRVVGIVSRRDVLKSIYQEHFKS